MSPHAHTHKFTSLSVCWICSFSGGSPLTSQDYTNYKSKSFERGSWSLNVRLSHMGPFEEQKLEHKHPDLTRQPLMAWPPSFFLRTLDGFVFQRLFILWVCLVGVFNPW